MGGFALAGYAARTLPIRSRTLRGHYKGTKSRLGHYRGQQISTGGNGKSAGNALVSAELKRVEKVHTHVRDVGAASSNLVTSTNYRRLNYEKKLVIQPFFVTWGVLRKTGFFPKWQVNTGKWQVKWQVENGQFVPVVGIFGVA